jgi:hypothetical protein
VATAAAPVGPYTRACTLNERSDADEGLAVVLVYRRLLDGVELTAEAVERVGIPGFS